MTPRSGYQALQGYPHLGREITIPSDSSSHYNNLNINSGSIGFSNIHVKSYGSETNTPTTHDSDAHVPHRGYRYNFWRLVIKPLGYKYDLFMFHLSFVFLYFN